MTRQKHLKHHIRERMARTGERYAAARRHIVHDPTVAQPDTEQYTSYQVGSIPATTALGVLLRYAQIKAPHTRQPFSEAMLFGIAGGIGLGVFSFFYERENIATFFLGGRYRWYDDQAYLEQALARLQIPVQIYESGSARMAAQQLETALEHGPCIAWVDMASLPHRMAPQNLVGSSYHVITIMHIDRQAGIAVIGDLTDQPISISLEALAAARSRIKKQQHRLLQIGQPAQLPDLASMVSGGLHAGVTDLREPALRKAAANIRLEALERWADRMEGARSKERWEHIYQPGPNLLRGLCAINDYIEHYGTGGGLCRSIYATFLHEAAQALQQADLAELARLYAALGQSWSELAEAALPNDISILAEAKALLVERAELIHSGDSTGLERVRQQQARLEAAAQTQFPLHSAAYQRLRMDLRERILALYHGEVAALAATEHMLASIA